eukprot:scaffold6504_cov40-Attheya_sp.AAC.2
MREIPYEIGVKQGDNMAPVLFIYLMNAFAETLSKKWTKNKWNTINGFQQPRMGIGMGDSQDRVRRQKELFSTFLFSIRGRRSHALRQSRGFGSRNDTTFHALHTIWTRNAHWA